MEEDRQQERQKEDEEDEVKTRKVVKEEIGSSLKMRREKRKEAEKIYKRGRHDTNL